MPFRIEKFSSTLKQSLADILRHESDNPVLKKATICRVTVTADLKKATVSVSALDGDNDGLIKELFRAGGFIRALLPAKMRLRFVPEIVFVKDSLIELDQKIAALGNEHHD